MRAGVIERRLPVTHIPSSGPARPAVPVLVDLRWAAAAPWSVQVVFPGDGGQVSWDFGLDLLAAGMLQPRPEPAQGGPMLVWTSGEQREATVLARDQDRGAPAGRLEARTSDLAEFLADALRTMAIRTATA